jgi:hypothetical protein
MNATCSHSPTASETACHLYDAEVALHIAHQTGVDSWISAAADRLHEAVVAHMQAVTPHALAS